MNSISINCIPIERKLEKISSWRAILARVGEVSGERMFSRRHETANNADGSHVICHILFKAYHCDCCFWTKGLESTLAPLCISPPLCHFSPDWLSN